MFCENETKLLTLKQSVTTFVLCLLLVNFFMTEHVLIQIGKRVKELRLQKEFTIAHIAKLADISKGLVSRIENGRTIPSLPVLISIIKALEADLPDFFSDLNSTSFTFLHQKKENYEPIEKGSAVGYNYLSILTESFAGLVFQATLLYLQPGAQREKLTTDGFEFIYLIDGEIEYILDNEQLTMKKGDSLFFDGRIPHLKLNHTDKIAEILVIYLLTSKN